MYKIKHISTGEYLTSPEIKIYSYSGQRYGKYAIFTSTSGKVWKTKGPAISAFKKTIKSAIKYNFDINDFILEKYELVVSETITAYNI